MTIQEIYNRFDVPTSLQQHMLRVAGLVKLLEVRWAGETVDWDVVLQAALLHDIANTIKFDLVRFPELLGAEESRRIDYWRAKQQKLIQQYGPDEHAAAEIMLTEIGVKDQVRRVIDSKTFGKAKELESSNDMPAKILLYADMRILPNGLGTLDARLEDIRIRLTKYSSRPDFPELVQACKAIEQTIQSQVDADLNSFIQIEPIDTLRSQLLTLSI